MKVRTKEFASRRKEGPGLLFLFVAVAAVSMVSARFMGVDPAALVTQVSSRFQTTSMRSDPLDVSSRGEAVVPVNRDEPRVLIYHAHASENYSPKQTHAARGQTGDVVEVGRELARALEAEGVRTLHVTGVYDDPWNEAYTASARAVQQVLEANPSIELVIDIHRDAIESRQAGIATAKVGEDTTAKILFAIGEQNNPHVQHNAEIASQLKERMDELYPGLSRGMRMLRQESNGHLHPNAVEVYIGDYYDSTLEEAKAAARLLAKVIAAGLQ